LSVVDAGRRNFAARESLRVAVINWRL
jgi:hypothetical protein